MPVVPMRGMVLFPHMTLNFDAARPASIKAIEAASASNSIVFLSAQKDIRTEEPNFGDIYDIGTVAKIRQVMRMPGGVTRVIVQGLCRGIVDCEIPNNDYLKAGILEYEDAYYNGEPTAEAYRNRLRKTYEEYFSQNPKLTADNFMQVMAVNGIGELCDIIAASAELDTEICQEILSEFDECARAEALILALSNQMEVLKLERQIAQRVKERIDKNQREYYLREQLHIIQEELDGGDGINSEAEEYTKKIKKLKTTKETKDKLLKEVDRFLKMPPSSSESAVVRTYLDTVLEMPWNKL